MKTFDEVFAVLPTDGWLSEAEARLLWRCCLDTTGPILEVGCFHGRSTVLMAAHGRIVYSVDPFDNFGEINPRPGDEVEKCFLSNLEYHGITNVKLFRERIEDWDALPVGLAYLDGDHTYQGTLSQIDVARKCNAKIIAIHDVNDYGGGNMIRRAAVGKLGKWDERVERLAVWIIK